MMTIAKVMDASAITLRRDSTLMEIYAVMNQYRQTDFPVLNEESHLVGMLYEENIREALQDSFSSGASLRLDFGESVRQTVPLLNLKAEELMTPDIGWVTMETSMATVAAALKQKRVRCLPVVGEGRVLGVVSERMVMLELLRQSIALKNSLKPDKPRPGTEEKKVVTEKRRHPRKPVTFKLAYKPISFKVQYHKTDAYGNPGEETARIAQCLNLSLGGMLIRAVEGSREQDVLDLVFEIPGYKQPIRRLARVTRAVEGQGGVFHLGLVFLALSAQEAAGLANYLKTLPE